MNKNLMEDIFIYDYEMEGQHTYISQIGILTIKSLIPSMDDLGVRVNYKRFEEELSLWKDYRIGDNPSLLNVKKLEVEGYWKGKDDSIISRIVPIVVANQSYDVIEEEVIRNILFTSGNINQMFEYLSISYILHLLLSKEEDVIEKLKEKIIGFGQVDFLERYQRHYRLSLDDYPGNYKVDFEKEKIFIINLLNEVDNGKYESLSDCIGVLGNKQGKTLTGKLVFSFLYGNEIDYSLPGFYSNMGNYLKNLRKSKIDPKDLEIKEYLLPDIFSFKEGDVFFHSLLRDSKIIKKEVRNDILTSLVQTRTGIYVFKKIDL